MKILVCVKQVPSSNEVRLDPITNTILRDAKQAVINPFDLYAVEQAVQIKEEIGGSVTAISMGIPAVQTMLKDLMARGVDRAYLLTDRAFAGSDCLATSYILSLGAKQLAPFDLIICGKMATDGDTAQIGPELSAQLNLPCITDVCEIQHIDEKEIVCRKKTDTGYLFVRGVLPLVITVEKGINLPRLPSIAGIEFGSSATVNCCNAELLNADKKRCGLNGSPTQVTKTFTPKREHQAIHWEGNISDIAKQAIEVWKEVC